jgi:hypothetical protein
MGPLAESEGHDAPRLVGELGPRLAAMGDDVVVTGEHAIGEPVLAHELPDVLDRVQFRGAGRQRQERDVVGHDQGLRHVPAGLVENQDCVAGRVDGATDLLEVRLHGGGIGEGHDERRTLPVLRADRPEDVRPPGALVVRCAGSCAAPGPAARDQVLLADPSLVLEPDLDALATGVAPSDLRHCRGEVFLNASMASGS